MKVVTVCYGRRGNTRKTFKARPFVVRLRDQIRKWIEGKEVDDSDGIQKGLLYRKKTVGRKRVSGSDKYGDGLPHERNYGYYAGGW